MNTKLKPLIVRHGELIMKQVDALPVGASLKESTDKKIVAWSESHHHHLLELKEKVDMTKMKFYTLNGATYVEVPALAELWHQKTGKDVHTPHTITPGIYKINIKKSFNYFKGLMERVRD